MIDSIFKEILYDCNIDDYIQYLDIFFDVME